MLIFLNGSRGPYVNILKLFPFPAQYVFSKLGQEWSYLLSESRPVGLQAM